MVWRREPPCKAQVILDKMFKDSLIAPDATAAAVHGSHPEFLKYNLNVFR